MDASEASEASDRERAGWAHDLGKPLQVIFDHGRRLAELADGDSQTRETALAIVALSRDALRVVDRLMEPEGARTSEDGDLASLFERAAEIVARLHPSHEIRISDAPSPIGWSPPDSLLPVLVNLIENAVQASPADRPVEIRSCEVGPELMIEVLDHGTGMSEYVRTRAFDRYFSTRRHPRSGARGLGLAEARVRVEALGGRIELESAVDRGTRASIRLPARGRPGSGW